MVNYAGFIGVIFLFYLLCKLIEIDFFESPLLSEKTVLNLFSVKAGY